MNKLLCLLLSLSIFLGFTTTTYATEYTVHDFIEYLEDGSYFTVTVTTNHTSGSAAPFSATRSGSKTTTYHSSSGSKLWSVTVTGTFTYGTGSQAACIKSTVSSNTYSTFWKITNSSASKIGNSASAAATGTQYRNSAPIDSITKTVTLTCSVNGTLS
jgi:hypothetical protein